jgi:uncharacterized hydrophobic protein (TIGR00271 family)
MWRKGASMADADSLTSELEDSDDARAGYDFGRLDLSRLAQPGSIRRLLGIGVALAVVFWPERSVVILGRLVGLGLIGSGIWTLWLMRTVRPLRWLTIASSLVAIGLGALLVVAPVETEVALGRLLGAAAIVAGALKFAEAILRRRQPDFGWKITSACSLAAIGLLVAAFPSSLLSTLTVAAAVVWIAVEVLSIAVLLDPDRDDELTQASTSALIAEWFEERPKAGADRQRLYGELLYEGDRTQPKVIRFMTLMMFASIIAATGVVADSTAVVVGAMLIAPLMTPLMGMALSLVMGWPNRLARSSLIALVGILIAIGIGFLIGIADFTIVDTMTNSQIVSRSNPTIVDLVIALAAGAAGAYAWSRPDVSNSLPGVAVAIALVPPLTVIGLSYSQRDWESGNGALLLFATNAIAILVMGAAVFLLTGVAPLSRATANQRRVRTALAAVGGAAAIISAALILNGTSVATNVFEQNAAARVTRDWVEPFPDHNIVSTEVEGDNVSVVLAGPAFGKSPSADVLAEELQDELGRMISVDLRIRLESREVSGD